MLQRSIQPAEGISSANTSLLEVSAQTSIDAPPSRIASQFTKEIAPEEPSLIPSAISNKDNSSKPTGVKKSLFSSRRPSTNSNQQEISKCSYVVKEKSCLEKKDGKEDAYDFKEDESDFESPPFPVRLNERRRNSANCDSSPAIASSRSIPSLAAPSASCSSSNLIEEDSSGMHRGRRTERGRLSNMLAANKSSELESTIASSKTIVTQKESISESREDNPKSVIKAENGFDRTKRKSSGVSRRLSPDQDSSPEKHSEGNRRVKRRVGGRLAGRRFGQPYPRHLPDDDESHLADDEEEELGSPTPSLGASNKHSTSRTMERKKRTLPYSHVEVESAQAFGVTGSSAGLLSDEDCKNGKDKRESKLSRMAKTGYNFSDTSSFSSSKPNQSLTAETVCDVKEMKQKSSDPFSPKKNRKNKACSKDCDSSGKESERPKDKAKTDELRRLRMHKSHISADGPHSSGRSDVPSDRSSNPRKSGRIIEQSSWISQSATISDNRLSGLRKRSSLCKVEPSEDSEGGCGSSLRHKSIESRELCDKIQADVSDDCSEPKEIEKHSEKEEEEVESKSRRSTRRAVKRGNDFESAQLVKRTRSSNRDSSTSSSNFHVSPERPTADISNREFQKSLLKSKPLETRDRKSKRERRRSDSSACSTEDICDSMAPPPCKKIKSGGNNASTKLAGEAMLKSNCRESPVKQKFRGGHGTERATLRRSMRGGGGGEEAAMLSEDVVG